MYNIGCCIQLYIGVLVFPGNQEKRNRCIHLMCLIENYSHHLVYGGGGGGEWVLNYIVLG